MASSVLTDKIPCQQLTMLAEDELSSNELPLKDNLLLKSARFGFNLGISESMKKNLIARGAIFEDYPGDRSITYALK